MAARLLARKFRRPARRPPLRRRRSMPRWPPPPLRQRRPLLRKPAAHEATAAAAANKQHALDARPRKSPTCRESPATALKLWTTSAFPWGGGHSTTTPRRGAAVVAAPRHELRRGYIDGPRPSHARVHGEYLGLIFAAAHVLIGISVWYFDYDYISTAVVPLILHTIYGKKRGQCQCQ